VSPGQTLFALSLSALMGLTPSRAAQDVTQPRGLWVWDWKPVLHDPHAQRIFLDFCGRHRVSVDWMQVATSPTPTGRRLDSPDDWWSAIDEHTGEPMTAVTFRGVRQAATDHLLEMVDVVGIMDYRTVVQGPGGADSVCDRDAATRGSTQEGARVRRGRNRAGRRRCARRRDVCRQVDGFSQRGACRSGACLHPLPQLCGDGRSSVPQLSKAGGRSPVDDVKLEPAIGLEPMIC